MFFRFLDFYYDVVSLELVDVTRGSWRKAFFPAPCSLSRDQSDRITTRPPAAYVGASCTTATDGGGWFRSNRKKLLKKKEKLKGELLPRKRTTTTTKKKKTISSDLKDFIVLLLIRFSDRINLPSGPPTRSTPNGNNRISVFHKEEERRRKLKVPFDRLGQFPFPFLFILPGYIVYLCV